MHDPICFTPFTVLTLKFFLVRMLILSICCKHLCNKEFLFRKCAKFFLSSSSTWPKLVAGCKHFNQWVRNLGCSLGIFFWELGLFEEENCSVALQLSKKEKLCITCYLKYLRIGSNCDCYEVLCWPGLWSVAVRTGRTMRAVSVLIALIAVCLPAKQGKQKLPVYSSCDHDQTSSRQKHTCHLRNHTVPVFGGQKIPNNEQPVPKCLGPSSIGMIGGKWGERGGWM